MRYYQGIYYSVGVKQCRYVPQSAECPYDGDEHAFLSTLVLKIPGTGSRASNDGMEEEPRVGQAKAMISWEMTGVAVRDTAPFTTIRPVNNRQAYRVKIQRGQQHQTSLSHLYPFDFIANNSAKR